MIHRNTSLELIKSLNLPCPPVVLDAGCGAGNILCSISMALGSGFQGIGIDISVDALEVARMNAKTFGLDSLVWKE